MALLYLTTHDGCRAWKNIDWDAMNRLHEKEMIDNPVNKAKSVAFTEKNPCRIGKTVQKNFCG
ncbi:MAG: hypothetical protein A2161_20335 [Candidatus Schekmanbacteria bacterium RBG_13_48_7]|uniref:DUF6429 domain-containing protein n=1 Tax=Candidatus Schekmanbacteria bacterium RBG_13_48_7 TaxID=1817878 RepID=A0A1F7RIU4_9BACT|nr:MAG: hypothetical protein A2161_20335 [Candidatus Schekmanbacteria bacterium RBG_13_48_7]